jgi:hypothetical protein
MRKLILTAAALVSAVPALAVAAPASAAPQASGGPVAPLNAPCGTAGPNLQNQRFNDAPAGGAAKQRSGSSTGCTAPGVLQPTDDAIYFCWTGNGNFTWTYLQNIRTGVRGWVRDDLLDGNGSNRFCGF